MISEDYSLKPISIFILDLGNFGFMSHVIQVTNATNVHG